MFSPGSPSASFSLMALASRSTAARSRATPKMAMGSMSSRASTDPSRVTSSVRNHSSTSRFCSSFRRSIS